MEVSWEVLVSPWLLWLQEKPILLSEACGTPWLHKATMWRWRPPGFPTSQQALKQRDETCSARCSSVARRRGDSHVGLPTVRDMDCQESWKILRAGH